MRDIEVYTLFSGGCDAVAGARIDMSFAAVQTLCEWLDTEERIKDHNDISIPCVIRDQLRAIQETHERLGKEGVWPTDVPLT
jgi:hypothetical protein